MSTNTKTAPTVHGSVEYETVECASCGQEVLKDEAKDAVVGDLKSHSARFGDSRYRFNGNADGVVKVCPMCVEEPIGFSIGLREWFTAKTDNGDMAFAAFMGFMMGSMVVVFLLIPFV